MAKQAKGWTDRAIADHDFPAAEAARVKRCLIPGSLR
jgi:hypothetical protein